MKFTTKLFVSAVLILSLGLGGSVASAEEGGTEAELQNWSFSGLFGTYDENQLQRGFQIFKEVCSNCHSANLLAFRNLSQEGGPGFSEAQVKALAATYKIVDVTAEGGQRNGVAADRWPAPFATEQDARDSNGGALPPDFSVLAKARGIHQDFPYWVFNYFTAYQEGGPDFIYNLLTNYHDAPEGVEVPPGKYYNAYLGSSISMSPPLGDGYVTYAEAEGASVPETLDQYSHDVAAFMMWMADPHMANRKSTGFRVMIILIVLAGMMYLVKRRIWANAH